MALYEYRRYQVVHGRMEELKSRFAEATIPMWRDAGIEPVAFFESRIGDLNVLHYLLKWNDLGRREEAWEGFRVNPEWVAARKKSEENDPLLTGMTNEIRRTPKRSTPPGCAAGPRGP